MGPKLDFFVNLLPRFDQTPRVQYVFGGLCFQNSIPCRYYIICASPPSYIALAMPVSTFFDSLRALISATASLIDFFV